MAAAAVAVPSVQAMTLVPSSAYAHGTMNNPPSRTWVCFNEGPEHPKTAACKQAVAIEGTLCGGDAVKSISSRAFNPQRVNAPSATAPNWYPTFNAVRKGTHTVTVTCAGGGLARTVLTVS